MKQIEEKVVKNYKERKTEFRMIAKKSIQKIQSENVKNYNRKRKTANEYKLGDLLPIE